MRENYLKSFFKSFGFIPVILAILGVVGVGYVSIFHKIGSEQLCLIATSCILATSCGFALLGFSGLKREQISFNDFTRCVFMVSSIVLGVFELNVGTKLGLWFAIAFFAVAGLIFIQTIIRLVKCVSGDPDRSYKNYFGALVGTFNPIFILILGLALGAAVVILGKYIDFINVKLVNISNYKYLVLGACGAIGVLTLLSATLDKDTEVTFIDFILAVLFVATVSVSLFTVPTDDFGQSFPRYVIVVAGVMMVCLLIRALTYTQPKSYVNSMHKVRTYFKSAYDKYDIILPMLIGLASLVILAVSLAAQNPEGRYWTINAIFRRGGAITPETALVYTIVSVSLLAVGILFTFIYHKFTSQDIVRVDKVLVFLIFTSAIITAFEAILWFVYGKFALTTLIALIAGGVTLLYSVIVLSIRLRNYNPIAAFATAQPYKYEAKTEEEPQEEAPAEEEVVEEEDDSTDPFGLTAEDEAIYEAIYGKDEAEEKEVVEEQPEEVEEEVIYEEVPAEEAQEEVVEEEVPAEEVEDAEEADEEDEEESEEAEEAEEAADEAEEVHEPEEEKKESNIVIQEFQVVDENGEPKKIKRKFNTKMMFAPYETKEYYNEIKNYLTMYRAKGRISSSCETFRYKGLVAKVALGGKSVKVFLALDTAIIDENPKYHLKDFSEKKRYQEVPVMIKVRSPRSLKYFKELVDIMMANRGVKPKRNFEPTDYMPQLIPNGEAILASLGMSTYYLQNTMNVKGIPEEMPDDLEEYIPMIAGDPLEDEEMEANVYLDTLCQHFEDGAEVTIDILKSLHIVKNGNVIHIKARGTLDRKLIIYAEYFDSDALKMLMCTNGTAIKIVR